MAQQSFNPTLDFTTGRSNNRFTCNEETVPAFLNAAGTTVSDRSPDSVYFTLLPGRSTSRIAVGRTYMKYDLSSRNWANNSTINSVTLVLTKSRNSSAQFKVMKSAVFNSAAASVHASYDSSTPYSSAITMGNTSVTITLNAAGYSAILSGGNNSTDSFYIGLVESAVDLVKSVPCNRQVTLATDFHSTQAGTATQKPTLIVDYTLAAVTYGNKVLGMSTTSMAKTIDIATADIEKIIGI